MTSHSNSSHRTDIKAEALRLRIVLAAVLLTSICAFALAIAWLGRGNPVRPLLEVKVSLLSLLAVYAVGVGVAWVYARWIRARRDRAL